MGTWGTGPFENDGGLDWIDEIARGGTDLARFRAGFEAELSADGYVGEYGEGVLALLRIARIIDEARMVDEAPAGAAGAAGAAPDPAVAGIRPEDFREGLTPEYRGWLAVAAEKVLSPQASDLYDRWALTDELEAWLATAREDLEHLQAELERLEQGRGVEPEGQLARP
ncbi:hypothetical protein NCCP1664_22010 [Zafaria cholistanensis]|uniref:DUF4259 domain-containing protein n=1 Tax=Zafaria cholistanensis TaxID=1682741 RepID=A0A5A7NSZ2_9MICC|nr:DUF4259 domain-containing protein [Zafaria cholistanensis]GER23706.1 hypothetical protein NCCP1664_22010 [Zafaria cholistanensis]